MTYSLKRYFEEAKISTIPECFEDIEVTIRLPDGSVSTPRWHQVTGLNLCFLQERTGLYDEQGTGKTLISQAFALWQACVGNKAICLMPPVVLEQYKDSFYSSFSNLDKYVTIEIYEGVRKKREKMLTRWNLEGFPGIVIMTYDLFREEWEAFGPHYNCLIMDECRVLGNPQNIVYEQIEEFMGKYGEKYALAMNGTPAKNNLSDLFGYIHFVSPWIYKSRTHFDLLHVRYKTVPVRIKEGKIRDTKIIDSFDNIQDLYSNLYVGARRVEKREVLELPPKNIINFPVKLSHKHKEKYDEFVATKLLIFDNNAVLDGSTSSSMRQNAMRAVIHTDLLQIEEESAVLAAVGELLEQIGVWNTKVFLLCHYQKTVEKLAIYLKKYKPALIYGKSNGSKEKARFLNDPECRVAIANYVAGGVGLNLQSVCYNAIAVEPSTVPGDFDQACDRLHRSGQEKGVNIYVLQPKGTIFVTAMASMVKKKIYNSSVVSAKQLRAEMLGQDLSDFLEDDTKMQPSAEEELQEVETQAALEDRDTKGLAPGWQDL